MPYTNIDDPSAYFQTVLYTGTGSANNAITNDGNSDLQPDWIWFKSRDAGHSHYVVDSNRGRALGLYPDGVNSEVTSSGSTTDCQSFDSNGFTVGTPEDANSTNSSSSTKVAWQWKANGGTTSNNTDGSITSTVQANQDAGFSIVTWTGNENASATVGHGLGVAPDMWIAKRRNGTYNWQVYTSALAPVGGNNLILALNSTAAAEQITGTSFTSSSTFQPGSNAKRNSGNMIAYCFAEKQGYSKFGSYIGNGFSNGPFVYTGFKPAFVLIKNADATQVWIMYDGARKPFNRDDNVASLYANTSGAEYTGASYHNLDILSNGFKIRLTDASQNGNGNKHIYMAFAENPFVTSTGVPTTAR